MPDQDSETDALLGQAVRVSPSGIIFKPWGPPSASGAQAWYIAPTDTPDRSIVHHGQQETLRAFIRDLGEEPVEARPDVLSLRPAEAPSLPDPDERDRQGPDTRSDCGGRGGWMTPERIPDPWGGVTPAEVREVLARCRKTWASAAGPGKACASIASLRDLARLDQLIADIPEPRPEEGGDG